MDCPNIHMQDELIKLSTKAKQEGAKYPKKRFCYSLIKKHINERIFIALVGPRGVGKTILLKQLLSETESSFYISLDTEKPGNSLFDLAEQLSEKGIKFLFLDEVHYYPGFGNQLKKIYDFLPLNVILTSSSSLSLHDSSYDLSRRVRKIRVPPFSLREFLYFKTNKDFEAISLSQLLDQNYSKNHYGKIMDTETYFEKYIKGKNYAFTLDKTDILPLFRNVLETIINNDLILTGKLTPSESLETRKMLTFIGKSPVEDISYSSISTNVGITKYKAEKYVSTLEKAFVLHQILPKGSNVTKEPKILFAPPFRLLYKSYDDCIGSLREDFFVDTMSHLGFTINYLKSKRGQKVPDYVLDNVVFEIGGISKKISQFKGFNAKRKIILTHPGKLDDVKRPLFFVGFLQQKDTHL